MKQLLVFLILVSYFSPRPLFAYSRDYCISLLNSQTEAINHGDYKTLLSVATDRVKNCGQFITAYDLSESLEALTLALRELGDPKSALRESDHCLQIADNPGCRIERGLALLALSRQSEAVDELKRGKRLAGEMLIRSEYDLRHADTPLDRNLFQSKIFYYQSIIEQSDNVLAGMELELHPKPKTEPAQSGKYTGSGFLVNLEGQLLTNKHVVDNCKSITVTNSAGEKSRASLVRTDETLDLAILTSQLHSKASATFRSEPEVQIGESISAIGYPLAGLLAKGANVSFGNIGAIAGLGNDQTRVQVSAPIQPGNSGGPIIDHSGLVVGIVVQKLDATKMAKLTGDIPQNINFAVNGKLAQQFLYSANVNFTAIPTGLKLDETEIAKKGILVTVFVECER